MSLEAGVLAIGNSNTVRFFDVSAPLTPVLIKSVTTAGLIRRVRLHGRLALISEGTTGVELFDVFPATSTTRRAVLAAGRADDAIVVDDRLIIADGTVGVTVSAPLAPAMPAVTWRSAPVSGTAAGDAVQFAVDARGIGVDELRLVVDDVTQGSLGSRGEAQFSIPPDAIVGTRVRYRVEAWALGSMLGRSTTRETIVNRAVVDGEPRGAAPVDVGFGTRWRVGDHRLQPAECPSSRCRARSPPMGCNSVRRPATRRTRGC